MLEFQEKEDNKEVSLGSEETDFPSPLTVTSRVALLLMYLVLLVDRQNGYGCEKGHLMNDGNAGVVYVRGYHLWFGL